MKNWSTWNQSLLSLAIGATLLLGTSCGKKNVEDKDELAQAAGDAASGVDEALEATGFALWAPDALTKKSFFASLWDGVAPDAEAGTCLLSRFTSCSVDKRRIRTLDSCTFGSVATLSGSVTLTFSDTHCRVDTVGDTITRAPDFTLTGRKSATLTVTSDGGGQKITRTADGFLVDILGMKRVLKDESGITLAEIKTSTISSMTATGTSRSNRVLNGGEIKIENVTKAYTLTATPNSLTWTSSCNCPVSGSLSGKIDGIVKADDAKIEFTGCGTAKVTANGKSEDITADRCAAI